ncbi:Spc7-domain-containing protein [Cucurbitaria berberidis CBS 394.84]|uniref:Spc7-domain-containing protein n=1 Tax=Cucurbitaria berberidis CBS 394.84 TaxID=1168544 RepID=A0A9P4L5B1_9PLEO|nr:Spc7-domain-containing protein [Cucurbitaria berberidis CBS 394.84]KAF1841793.1 Spc7-domain-containing protein [Cucurbitaria berberidis CBS 394.84]
MAQTDAKENIADGLLANTSFKAPTLSLKKSSRDSRKTRSKSIGPGGLGELEAPALKESSGNRRKSAFIPAVKSILSSNDEDEKKRREARRKSLAKRRVSFAPEATLHTWDVVEYLRDATSSSASSDATRRASNITQASTPASPAPAESPSTPPEQAEEPQPEPESSPANQREQHQKKNRRSSGIPPMNFNNPDDVYSSSPLSGDNQSPGGVNNEGSISGDDEDVTENLATSPDTEDSSQSSARLDAALRQASTQAGTQRLDFDNKEDMTMDIAQDEITASFKPWARKSFVAQEDQENVDPSPFSPAATVADDDDMSMDITRAVGRIVPQQQQADASSSDMDEDMSMELTMPLGSIQAMASNAPANRRKSLKRRVSMLDASQGSPAKRPANRRTSLRQRRQSEEIPSEDATMDLTMAIGAIKNGTSSGAVSYPNLEGSLEDATMDFTMAVGSIKNGTSTVADEFGSDAIDEDLSMEFTKIIGPGIRRADKAVATPENPTPPPANAATPAKTPTPRKTSKKSPGRRRSSIAIVEAEPAPEVQVQATPMKAPVEARIDLDPDTPEIVRQKDIEDIEPSPFVRRTPVDDTKTNRVVATPTSEAAQEAPMMIPDDPVAAPILNRRRSSLSLMQFSPLNAPREEPTLKSTAFLTNSIKLLSTPRKQMLISPVKRGMTPKKSQTPQKLPTPKQKTPTPKKATPRKSVSPKKRVGFGEQLVEEEEETDNDVSEGVSDVERISLQEFLDMTKIRFMDLSTTKRRHTAAPAAFHDMEVEEKEESLDRYVVAGACTLPEYELYQHACHEMKKYISDGRHFVRTMEANVYEENPLLFSEYLTAPPDQRIVMDNQFKNLKTNARLEARGEWYTWRSTLLQDLKSGLLHTLDGFKRDESTLANQEQLLDVVLPPLIEKHELLSAECKQLQQRHDELNSCDREELEQTRERLVATDIEMEEKRQLLEQLQQELAEKEARIEAVKDRKVECVEEIKVAERVREECRGWSTREVNDLKVKVTSLEQAHGWSITSASSTSITMTHLNDLELYFQPSAFATGTNSPNASISLAYVGDSATPHPRPLTTSKRFFLQLIRAHLHCIPQSQTRISSLLTLVKDSWATALAVTEGIHWLEHNYITEEFILSDERMAIASNMLLPTVQTKVKVTFEVGVGIGKEGVDADVGMKAEIVYGEKYGEEKMGAFLRDFCGSEVKKVEGMSVWADGMLDLASRLKKTGRKGERK